MNYREVKCSDRLPEKEHPNNTLSKSVFVIYGDGDGSYSWYDYTDNAWYGREAVLSWLEPYELPTEEEIEKILKEEIYHYQLSRDSDPVQLAGFDEAAKAITNLLKGE